MLGIGNSLMTSGVKLFSPNDISNLVAHYDFSDASRLKQNDDGTTAVSSNNDPIGYAENLASNGLGTFVKSYSDAGRPLYKTGGANSKSYAQFDGSSGCGLIAGIEADLGTSLDGDVFGGISSSAYSDIILYQAAISIFAVCKTDVEDITVSDDYSDTEAVVFMSGYNGGDDIQRITLVNRVNTTPGTEINRATAELHYSGSPTSNDISYNDEDNWTTEDRLMSIITASGTAQTRIEKNAGVDAGDYSTGTISANEAIDMRTSAGDVQFSIGAQANVNALNPNSQNWNGRIYEILIYNKSVTDAEKLLIKNYINAKYDLWS